MIAGPAAAASRLHGRLTLAFAAGRHGTVLRHAEQAAPLKIVRPFPLAGGGLLVQVLTLGPGMCGGDRHTIEVTVEPGARAVIIMQSASRLLAMDEGDHARLDVTLTVRSGGQLEYYPGLTIPFAGSSFIQRIDARLSNRAAGSACSKAGRPDAAAAANPCSSAAISARTPVSVDGAAGLCGRDGARAGEAMTSRGAGVLEGHRYVASGFWHGATLGADDPLRTSDGTLVALGQSRPEAGVLAGARDGWIRPGRDRSARRPPNRQRLGSAAGSPSPIHVLIAISGQVAATACRSNTDRSNACAINLYPASPGWSMSGESASARNRAG